MERAEDELALASKVEMSTRASNFSIASKLTAPALADAVAVAGHLVLLRPGDGSCWVAWSHRQVAMATRRSHWRCVMCWAALERVIASLRPLSTGVWRVTRAYAGRALSRLAQRRGRGAHAGVGARLFALQARAGSLWSNRWRSRSGDLANAFSAELHRDAARILGMSRTPLFRGGHGRGHLDAGPPAPSAGRPRLGARGSGYDGVRLSLRRGARRGDARACSALWPGTRSSRQSPRRSRCLSAAMRERVPAGPHPGECALPACSGRRFRRGLNVAWSSLCAQKDQLSAETCLGYSTLVLRRVGLLVSGDIRTAVVDACECRYRAAAQPGRAWRKRLASRQRWPICSSLPCPPSTPSCAFAPTVRAEFSVGAAPSATPASDRRGHFASGHVSASPLLPHISAPRSFPSIPDGACGIDHCVEVMDSPRANRRPHGSASLRKLASPYALRPLSVWAGRPRSDCDTSWLLCANQPTE